MRKRFLIGLLTVGMLVQSLSMPALAAPAAAAETLAAAEQPGDPAKEEREELPEEHPDGPTGEEPEEVPEERPEGPAGEEPEENPEEKPDGPAGEEPEENPEEKPEGPVGEEPEEEPEEPAESEDGQKPSGEEDPSGGDDISGKEDDEAGAIDLDSELYDEQISGNDLFESEPEPVMVWDELDGVYQFGGAPSERGNFLLCSEQAYSNADVLDYLYEHMLKREETIDVSAYNIPVEPQDNLKKIVSGVLNEHPDLYFVERYYGYYQDNTGTKVTKFAFTYDNSYDDDAVQRSVQTALSTVNGNMSDLQKAIVLHDYLTVNCEYDKENLDKEINGTGKVPDESYSIYGVFAKRTAVCQGYALAYKYLLNREGIECCMVTSDTMNHAWNMIRLDGKYYQVDVTWDDPTWDRIGSSRHTYMFRSDAAFEGHSNWKVTIGSEVVDLAATDTRYDSAFWTGCTSPLVIDGNVCYYIFPDSYPNKCSLRKGTLSNLTGAGTTVQSIDRWVTWGGGGFWPGAYSGLFQIDGRLFYNDMQSIYSIAPDGTDRRIEFTADTAAGYIYGSAYCQGKVLYALRQTPNLEAKETVLTADITVGGGGSDIPTPTPAPTLPEVDMTPSDGNVVMGFSGAYYTESADKILGELNRIRKEACQQGVKNPSTGNPLTMDDYVPLKWSSDLEAIARLRAAEASVRQEHTRLNGTSCFTVRTTSNQRSFAENLAWNNSGLMAGIQQWYEEKDDWVKQTGKVTGHYTSIINPKYTYVAVGAFRLSTGGWYSVAQEFNTSTSMDERKDTATGNCVQYMEVSGDAVTKLQFDAGLASFIQEGNTYPLSLKVTAAYKDYYGAAKSYSGPYQAGGSWSSSNGSVASVDQNGIVTARAKGIAAITVSAGAQKASFDITVYGQGESPIQVERPAVTTYKVGGKLNLKGGKVTYVSDGKTVTKELTTGMVSGFDSSAPGICTVAVICNGYAADFDTLIVAEPELTADIGQKLKEILLPANDYGTYAWKDDTLIADSVGAHTFEAVFTPNDGTRFQTLTDLQIPVSVQMAFGSQTEITFKVNTFTYNATAQQPKPVVLAAGVRLVEGQDYTLSYQNNTDVGTATAIVQGINYYRGSKSVSFAIGPAKVTITAKDKTIRIGDTVPKQDEYEYEVKGLMGSDILKTAPSLSCKILSGETETAGRYDIVPSGADAGGNYEISYVNGTLTVASEYVSYTVSYDVQGHGTAPAQQIDVKAGSTIDRPEDPAEAGYRFDGWYRDRACSKVWNFDMDIVQDDMTLYAKWLGTSEKGIFALQEIGDMYYTGKALKPAVSVYDGDTLLKPGRDYQIRYYNNTSANANGVRKTGNGTGASFNEALPYAEIIGKGNYTETVKVNFNILRTSIGDGSDTPAAGVTLRVNDQLVTSRKALKSFSSIKCVKAMKADTDFALTLTVVNARDQSGKSLSRGFLLENAMVPAGYEGEFLLTIQGIGNYTGSVHKTVHVTDKAHLIKNVRITIGNNLKNITFAGAAVELTPSEENTADTFTVASGKNILVYNKDYTVSYRNNDRVGKAELIVTGMGEYAGSRTATFQIKGKPFSAKTVRVEKVTDQVYTGRALTQNDALVIYGADTETERQLKYGTDYTISYTKNISKGTATMTFKSMTQAGFSGSFKKTFRITAYDIARTKQSQGMQNISLDYCKSGVKPVDQIVLTDENGLVLRNGRDYTLRYVNNKAVAGTGDEKPPTVVVKGKGNYAGELNIYFTIRRTNLQAALDAGSLQIKTSAVVYNPNKEADYAYEPAVRLMEGKTALRAGTDYEIEYFNNTQADYEDYMQKLESGAPMAGADIPRAVIFGKADANYALDANALIDVPLPVYRDKLTKSNLVIELEEAVYTGGQVTPAVKVSYLGETVKLLQENKDYMITYGANKQSGKNKGSVTISGIAPYYGGSVTVKFEVKRKPIMY